jgi:peptidoglycan hydrolase FlgJ
MEMSGLSSTYTDYITSTAETASSKLSSKLSTDYSNASDDELMDACKQFESYFLEQVFKEMEKTVPDSEESSGSNSTLVDYYKDNMIQQLATESTDKNSLGIAQKLYEQMKRNYDI